jgi:hypothetical protein
VTPSVGGNRLLVEERTDKAARLQVVKLSRRADILGTTWDDDTTSPSLEQLKDPPASGVPVLRKRLAVDLGQVEGAPGKIEGVARVDHDTLALINDGSSDSRSLGNPLGRLDGTSLGREGSWLGTSDGILSDGVGRRPVVALLSAGCFLSDEPSPLVATRTTAETTPIATITASRMKSMLRRRPGQRWW